MNKKLKTSRDRSLLEIEFTNHCKFTNQQKKDVANTFGMSYQTLYRKLRPDYDLQADFLEKLAKFLNREESDILFLHKKFENDVEIKSTEKQIIFSKKYFLLLFHSLSF